MRPKAVITVLTICLIAMAPMTPWGGSLGMAFEGDIAAGLSLPTSEEILSRNTESPFNYFSHLYTKAFRKTLNDKHFSVAIYFSDLSGGLLMTADDPWLTEQTEAQAKILARQALYAAIQDTVNEVQILHRVREYGRSLTTAEVKMKEGEMDFAGPSLTRAARGSEEETDFGNQDFFRSRLTVSGGVDLGLSWRTTLGPVESRLTYFLVGDDLLGATLSRRLTDWSRLDLTYRTGPDEQRALATLNFSLP